ncbi:transporter [Novosphingobium sp. BL-8H]|uniref:transporter n=1 Tax=Novosphingobium sp. BL-8H TaxID=3127640 RepID=UPI00375653A9
MRVPAIVLFSITLLPTAAWAEDRDYCPDRPGIGTPACTMAPGQFSLEMGVGDWTLNKDDTQRTDTFTVGDALLRYGIADHAEVQVGWSMVGFARTRDKLTGAIQHQTGTGDVTLALRRNLANPDGSGFSIAVMPYVSLPVGTNPLGAGDWGAGALLPMSYELSDGWSLASTTEVDAAVDGDGHGRHFAVAETVGASFAFNDKLSASAEYQVLADHDPEGHSVQHLSGLSLAWQPRDDLQFDVGANAGLDRDADDLEVYFGVSRRF